ncbi:MAG: type II toxin-antitoxin system VapC family toxin [Rhodoplanes sp.]
MTLVDTNVLLDILARDPVWFDWSIEALVRFGAAGPLLINEVVYAEMSARLETQSQVEEAIEELGVLLNRIPVEGLFLAGQTFRRYRRAGGVRTGVLPDFFVGAHAQVMGLPLLTRDLRRYQTYFPGVHLITPEAHR